MAQFRKILLSGSNAHVAAVTASGVATAGDNDTVLFRNPSTGVIKTLSTLALDDSAQSLDFTGGTFSGSFSGSGAGLTGVNATIENPLEDGAGITGFTFDGTGATTIKLDLKPDGGLTFFDGSSDVGPNSTTTSNRLALTSSLPGDGLEWQSQYNKIRIDLDGTSGGTSGLKTGSAGLALSDTIDGQGIDLTNGVLKVDLSTNSGLEFSSNKLRLASSLDGTGLTYTTANSVLAVDTSTVVTNANTISFVTSSTNFVISVTSDGTVTELASGSRALLIDNPKLAIGLNETLSGDFTFNDNVLIKGDLTVDGGSSEVNFDTQNLNIADQFILLNSGSTSGDGGFVVQTDSSAGAFLFYDSNVDRWGVSQQGISLATTNFNGYGSNTAHIATVEVGDLTEAQIAASTPIFGSTGVAASIVGQLKITTTPSSNESAVFIYA
jgi:hypothetical protein